MNVIDWMRETARYMSTARPDIYNEDNALAELSDQMEYLRNEHFEDALSAIMTGGFVMLRIVEDTGQEEFQVCRFISSVTTFWPEEDCLVIGGVDEIDLPRAVDSTDDM